MASTTNRSDCASSGPGSPSSSMLALPATMLAATLPGDGGPNHIVGTPNADTITGLGGERHPRGPRRPGPHRGRRRQRPDLRRRRRRSPVRRDRQGQDPRRRRLGRHLRRRRRRLDLRRPRCRPDLRRRRPGHACRAVTARTCDRRRGWPRPRLRRLRQRHHPGRAATRPRTRSTAGRAGTSPTSAGSTWPTGAANGWSERSSSEPRRGSRRIRSAQRRGRETRPLLRVCAARSGMRLASIGPGPSRARRRRGSRSMRSPTIAAPMRMNSPIIWVGSRTPNCSSARPARGLRGRRRGHRGRGLASPRCRADMAARRAAR